MSSSASLLDLQSVSQRQATWRFDLLDVGRQKVGTLDVERTTPPTMSVDTARVVKRTVSGLRLPPHVLDDVDVVRNRVAVTMVLDDGSEWPQGVYLLSDVSRLVVSVGLDVAALNLVDQLLVVDQQLDRSVSYGPGKQVTVALDELLSELLVDFELDSSGAVISAEHEAVAWPAGTSRLRVVNELARMIGFHELYFDNSGVGQLRLMPNPETAPDSSVLRYPLGGRTYLGSTVRSTDLLELPNRFVVVNTGATQTPVYGVYDVPFDAPHSAANRGFVVTHVEELQGVETSANALVAARALARDWRFPFETVSFSSPPDPRHDHYDVVEFEGVRFLELNWSLPLLDGSEMRHTLRRTYETEAVET